MAYEGELVRLADGRWARFKRCAVLDAGPESGSSLLVAVELDERHQQMLSETEGAFEAYRMRGIPVRVRIDENPDGSEQVRFAEDLAIAAAAL